MACVVAIEVQGGTITSSPPPTFKFFKAQIIAFVPLTVVRQRSVPITLANLSSNSSTIFDLDQTPLLITSNTWGSSVSRIQTGHLGHLGDFLFCEPMTPSP